MVYEECLAERNTLLINIFGTEDKIPDVIPEANTLLNVTTGNGSLDNLIMPKLPVCDLEKELDNVSIIIIYCKFYIPSYHVPIRYISLYSQHRVLV